MGYVIEGGRSGKARLNVLAEVMRPLTTAMLRRVSVPLGGRCLDVGCGGGHVTLELARLVGGGGEAVGIDFDAEILALAGQDARDQGVTNVRFDVCDAGKLAGGPFDLAYARFLLSHVPDPAGVLASIVGVVANGGAVVVEDIDFRGSFCEPPLAAYDRYVELYRSAVSRGGGDADIGPRLPSLLRGAGLDDVHVEVVQPVAMAGEDKLVSYLTLEKVRSAVLRENLATAAEIDRTLGELLEHTKDSSTVFSLPRIVQSWGWVAR